jgi:hypothetical protein
MELRHEERSTFSKEKLVKRLETDAQHSSNCVTAIDE